MGSLQAAREGRVVLESGFICHAPKPCCSHYLTLADGQKCGQDSLSFKTAPLLCTPEDLIDSSYNEGNE